MQEKVTTYAKMKSKYWKFCIVKTCENWSGSIVRTAILKCSEKKLSLRFYGHMHGGDYSYPCVQLVDWNINEEKLHQRFSCDLFEITHNFYPTRGIAAISCQ